jgi:serine/threonine-protein kinase RsbT
LTATCGRGALVSEHIALHGRLEGVVAGSSYRSNGQHRVSSATTVNGNTARRREAPSRRVPPPGRIARHLAAMSAPDVRVKIDSDHAIVEARRHARRIATAAGLKTTDLTIIATVISELARNALLFANGGEIRVGLVQNNGHQGIEIVAADRGPGIADVERALEDGYSTNGRLGLGLPGVKRLMDDFEIASAIGAGTTVIVRKWKR